MSVRTRRGWTVTDPFSPIPSGIGDCPGATSAGHSHGCCERYPALSSEDRVSVEIHRRNRPTRSDWPTWRRCPVCCVPLGTPCVDMVGEGRGFPVEGRGPHVPRRRRTAKRGAGVTAPYSLEVPS